MTSFDALIKDIKALMKRHGVTYATFTEEFIDEDVKFLEIKMRAKNEKREKKACISP